MTVELVIAVDPDSRRSAIAWALCSEPGVRPYNFGDVDGGGSGLLAVSWQTITGMQTLLNKLTASVRLWGPEDVPEHLQVCAPVKVTVVVETQAPNGPQSADVEALRRVRYHWQATCEVVGARYVEVAPLTWMRVFTRDVQGSRVITAAEWGGSNARPGDPIPAPVFVAARTAGFKKLYQQRAKQLTPLATNEDRCAAIGMLDWYVREQGCELVFDNVKTTG